VTKHNLFSKLSNSITKFGEVGAITAGLLIMTGGFVIVYGVFIRYFFQQPTIWQIELAVYLLMVSTFAAAPAALHHNTHVTIDFLTEKIKDRQRNILYIIAGIFGILFALALAERSFLMWYEAYESDWRSDTVWGPKLVYPYAIIPLGMIWFSVQYFIEIGNRTRNLVKRDEEANKIIRKEREGLQ
jgi:TRAP-type C4-dicarboxylate transport system permease small subunit